MKALSIQQPWAWLIVNGYKDVENRDWPTNERGRVLIHAGKKFDADGAEWVRRTFPHIAFPPEFERGGIVGAVTIKDCVRNMESPWFFGDYGFVLADAMPLPLFAVRGQLGFFYVNYPNIDTIAPTGASPERTV